MWRRQARVFSASWRLGPDRLCQRSPLPLERCMSSRLFSSGDTDAVDDETPEGNEDAAAAGKMMFQMQQELENLRKLNIQREHELLDRDREIFKREQQLLERDRQLLQYERELFTSQRTNQSVELENLRLQLKNLSTSTAAAGAVATTTKPPAQEVVPQPQPPPPPETPASVPNTDTAIASRALNSSANAHPAHQTAAPTAAPVQTVKSSALSYAETIELEALRLYAQEEETETETESDNLSLYAQEETKIGAEPDNPSKIEGVENMQTEQYSELVAATETDDSANAPGGVEQKEATTNPKEIASQDETTQGEGEEETEVEASSKEEEESLSESMIADENAQDYSAYVDIVGQNDYFTAEEGESDTGLQEINKQIEMEREKDDTGITSKGDTQQRNFPREFSTQDDVENLMADVAFRTGQLEREKNPLRKGLRINILEQLKDLLSYVLSSLTGPQREMDTEVRLTEAHYHLLVFSSGVRCMDFDLCDGFIQSMERRKFTPGYDGYGAAIRACIPDGLFRQAEAYMNKVLKHNSKPRATV